MILIAKLNVINLVGLRKHQNRNTLELIIVLNLGKDFAPIFTVKVKFEDDDMGWMRTQIATFVLEVIHSICAIGYHLNFKMGFALFKGIGNTSCSLLVFLHDEDINF